MHINPTVNKLGYSDRDRLVIIHTDDIGMCHASIQAYRELVEFGLISSAATMVPCSWFPHIASFCTENPSTDMGVHLTLTSEWDSYRWQPISTREQSSGLIDEEGYFYRTSEDAQTHGEVFAVHNELKTQIERAISAGIEVTHLDTHMNTVAHPKFINSYVQFAIQYKLPLLFPRLDEAGYLKLGLDPQTAPIAAATVNILEDQGIPLVDFASGLDLITPTNRFEQASQLLSEIPPGITHFIIHPSIESPELKAITPDWQCRVADYKAFQDEKLRRFLDDMGIHVIGYKAIRDLIH